jgi:osmotically inducible protein OsmC
MQLSAYITEAGFEIESISKPNAILIGRTILTSHLTVQAKVTGITDAFQQLVTKLRNCPISKVLNAAISSTATLDNQNFTF